MNQSETKTIDWTNWINHELKTPLNRMESLLMSLDKSPNCGFEEKKIILKLKESLIECKNTLDSLYFFNKIQINKVYPRLEFKDLNVLLSNAIQDLEPQYQAKGLEVYTEFDPLFPIPLDDQLFKRAFNNVFENAIKYSPVKSKILVSTEEMNNTVYIQISDQGRGLIQEEKEKIFEPYFRSEEVMDVPGTGLGLYISKKFIEFHKGKIEVDSIPGKGSTFTISLPKEIREQEGE